MNTYQEEPDGFILYDDRPDPFDNRRAADLSVDATLTQT